MTTKSASSPLPVCASGHSGSFCDVSLSITLNQTGVSSPGSPLYLTTISSPGAISRIALKTLVCPLSSS